KKLEYSDSEIAAITSVRYLGVLLVALPLGFALRGKAIRPILLMTAISLPLISVLQLYVVQQRWQLATYVCSACWGIGFMIIGVSSLPFVLRHAPIESRSEAISLNYSIYSIAAILTGFLIPTLRQLSCFSFPVTEIEVLVIISVFGWLSVIFFSKMVELELPAEMNTGLQMNWTEWKKTYDWNRILVALLPTTVIAIGAGLTIPFIDLFFFHVFGLDSQEFSVLGGIASFLVFSGALVIPGIKRRFGYSVAITLSQSLAVGFLILLGLTEWMKPWQGAIYLAMFAYLVRQPLMNIAGPMTNELILTYTGPKNHELISALHSSIWSGSWFISSQIFKCLRELEYPYSYILFLTATLYTVGIIGYAWLIRLQRKVASE
ncbi:MAG: MFS transporter, partial [Bacteroidia bacterium]|nr:MFS transporter [Bacteroidia bacterium]